MRSSGPVYVSAKRTHRFLAPFWLEVADIEKVMTAKVGIFRWVRFQKRTQIQGVLVAAKAVSSENEPKSGWIVFYVQVA